MNLSPCSAVSPTPGHRGMSAGRGTGRGCLRAQDASGVSTRLQKTQPREFRGIVRRAEHLRAAYPAASAADDIVIEIGA